MSFQHSLPNMARPFMYVVFLTYLKPIEDVDQWLVPHRAYLDTLYQKGHLLASGPRIPRTGGILLVKGMPREELMEILESDPFHQQGIASYEPIEFDPVKHCDALKGLL
jgi:uncharacterized protein YciI